jgi:pSer/pThr/pTyr-binding forkhead associated (FHA) protein
MDKIHLRIGSNLDNDMVIESEGVDGHHLELFCDTDGNVFITDLNTKNGTFINGEELNGYALLSNGDKVVLGRHYVFRWESFVRKEPFKNQINKENEPIEVNFKKTKSDTGKGNKKIDLSASNKELILIYTAIILVLILMFFVF